MRISRHGFLNKAACASALVILIALDGCATVNLASFPEPYKVPQSQPLTDISLYIGAVNYRGGYPHLSVVERSQLRTLIASYFGNTHYFKRVAFQEDSVKYEADGPYLIMNVEIQPVEKGKFNWLLSWPAVYPMVMYWPLQARDGHVSVDIRCSFFTGDGIPVINLTSEKSDDYKIIFYGFFRTAPAEQKLAECYNSALEDIASQITSGVVAKAMTDVSRKSASGNHKPDTQATAALARQNIRSDVDDPPTKKIKQNKNSYALVIGIENYRQKLPAADFATRDAQTVTDYLTKTLGYPEENIITLLNDHAAKSDFQKYIEKWLGNNVEKDSSVFIYYSGHGAPNPKTGDAYLVPYDGDPSFIDETGYSLKRMYGALEKLPAKEIVVALDSCFSGAGGRSVLAKGARPIVLSVENSGLLSQKIVVFSAAAGDQVSSTYDEKGHGLFTYFMLRGIKNEDVVRPDGSLMISDLFRYVKPQVERVARKMYNNEQTPQLIGPKH